MAGIRAHRIRARGDAHAVRVRLPSGTELARYDDEFSVVFSGAAAAIACAEAILRAADGPTELRPGGGEAVFRRDGEYWTVAHQSGLARLRDTKGMRYLALLLAEPGREMCVLDLVAVEDRSSPPRPPSGSHDAGPMLDAAARVAYGRRLADLREELATSEQHNDLGRAALVRSEVEFVTSELTAGMGLHGRIRYAGSPLERARVAVTLRLREAIGRIMDPVPLLGRHLAMQVETGRICVYRPDVTFPIRWLL